MRRALVLASIGAAVCVTATSAGALGFGKVTSPALLGQPLDFAAVVQLDADEALERRCVSAEVMSGENRLAADQVRVTVQQAGADPATRTVRVTTLRAIDEPVVTVNVTVGCTSRVSRKFVTFLDPPVLRLAQASETGSDARPFEPQRLESQVAPLVAMLQPPRTAGRASSAAPRARSTAARRAHPRHAAAGRIGRTVRLSAAEQATTRSDRRMTVISSASVRAAPRGAPRLQLETAIAQVALAPAAPASAALPAAAIDVAPVMAGGDADTQVLRTALDQERERIRVLEAGLARLRTDAQATQKSLVVLQARLRDAETGRYANPLVYLLGGLCAVLVVVSALALRRRPRRGASRWWAPTLQPAAAASARAPVDVALDETLDDAPWPYQPSRLPLSTPGAFHMPEPEASSIGGLEVTTVIDHALFARMAAEHPAANELNPDAKTSADASTMEALIDLEQQAEFFVVLGQDEAAIDLLSRHGRGDGVSPLPFFRLLEIHRRRGEEAAYARVAEAFDHRFGTPAALWEDALAPSRCLDDYPQVAHRLQRLWATPTEAMQAIDAWVFRRQPAEEMLDAGACRELLLAWSVLRELLDNPVDEGIDLLLPIDEPEVDLTLPHLVAPSNFAELYTLSSRPAPLDLDISLEAAGSESERRKAI